MVSDGKSKRTLFKKLDGSLAYTLVRQEVFNPTDGPITVPKNTFCILVELIRKLKIATYMSTGPDEPPKKFFEDAYSALTSNKENEMDL